MSIILDLIFVGIIILSIIIGIKKGAVKIILSVVAFVVSMFLAYTLSTPVANLINNSFIEPKIIENLSENDITNAQDIIDIIPSFIRNDANKYEAELNSAANEILSNDNIDAEKSIVKSTISPIIIKLISGICILVLFLLFSVILNIFASIINKLIGHGILGSINALLGAAFGIIEGCIIVFALCFLISAFLRYNGSFLGIEPDKIENSYLYTFFINIFK